MTMDCNADCMCGNDVKYNPVCSQDGSTAYYSPCHAGCTGFQTINGSLLYSNCSCSASGFVTEGACPSDCTRNFMIFIVIICTMRFFGATGRAGSTLIQIRAVKPEDKSLSIAISEFMLAACAFIPGPVLYGHIMDTTCQVWGYACGKLGNCWLYNGQTLRFYLNFTASSFIFIAVMFDIIVWMNVKTLKMYDDEDEKQKKNGIAESHPFIENKEQN